MMSSIIKNKNTYFWLGVIFILVGWTILSAIINNDYVVPSIDLVLNALGKLICEKHTYLVLLNTLLRVFVAILACLVMGLLVGSLSYCSSRFEYFVKPIIILFKSLPLVVMIVLILLQFTENMAVFYIVSVVVFPVMYEATLNGLRTVDTGIIEDIRMVSNINFKVILNIHLKLALPSIITGIIQSFGLGLKVLVMAEYISQPEYSIGREIVFYNDIAVDKSYVFAWSFILIVFIIIFELLIANLSKRVRYN